jgi:cysteine desulfurase/selenocysteine lyase
MNVAEVRSDFPVTNSMVFLNVANHSPSSRPVQDAIRGYLLDWDSEGRRGDERVDEAIASFSRLIGADHNEVACQPSTSTALATVAESVGFGGGMNIVINDLENPANWYPWTAQRRRGVELRIVKGKGGTVTLDDLEKAIDDDTRVVAISHVEWLTGARHDLRAVAEIAHDHAAYLVVDGIQAAGAVRVDVKGDDVDFYACGGYKWLLGCSGAGFLYAKRSLITELTPTQWGYRAVEEHDPEEPKLKETAKKFELGEPSYLSFVGTRAEVEMILRLGPANVEARVLKLSQRLFDGLTALGFEVVSPEDRRLRSGIVSFRTRDTEATFRSLTEAGFLVSLRPAGLRVSPDFYNTEEEVDRLLGLLAGETKRLSCFRGSVIT